MKIQIPSNTFTYINNECHFISFQGDYTRTGERNLAGLVKDGMNSANR